MCDRRQPRPARIHRPNAQVERIAHLAVQLPAHPDHSVLRLNVKMSVRRVNQRIRDPPVITEVQVRGVHLGDNLTDASILWDYGVQFVGAEHWFVIVGVHDVQGHLALAEPLGHVSVRDTDKKVVQVDLFAVQQQGSGQNT